MEKILFEAQGLTKSFPGVKALKGVDFQLGPGSVHALVGENGAGKSTLIKILSGVYQPDQGSLKLDGTPLTLESPRAARNHGILTIHQELSLAQNLSVAENVFLGVPKPKRRLGMIDWAELYERTQAIMHGLGLDIDPKQPIHRLKIGTQQLVEIAKGFVVEPRILILDEPTAALSVHETEFLFNIINNIKAKGFGVIYISHRMEEIFEIADVATVLRDGSEIGTAPLSELTPDIIAHMMTGKDTSMVDRATFRDGVARGDEVLRVENLYAAGVNDVSFSLHRGEILGFAGLMGAGRSEIAQTIYGAQAKHAGEIYLKGRPVAVSSPQAALANGIGYTTEVRGWQLSSSLQSCPRCLMPRIGSC
ncbi:MAG: sugar ABC transporter ATP-binding protein [Spirochaeta sp.]|nr:sugar ABC transporter ATP-binding protein [Spirochaeta sp.]